MIATDSSRPKLKVVHIITGLGNGGAEALLYSVLSNDPDNKHFVISLTDSGRYGDRIIALDIDLYCLHLSRSPLSPYSFLNLYHILCHIQPDLVHCWMYHANLLGGLVSKLAGYPILWSVHQAHADVKRNGLRNALLIRLGGLLSHFVPSAVTYCSEFARVAHLQVGYMGQNSSVLHNGIDLNRFRALSKNERSLIRIEIFGHNPSIPILGMAARYTHEKDFTTLFAALHECMMRDQEFALVLVGNEMEASNQPLLELITQFGLREHVYLLGSRDDIERIIGALDIHILSSYVEGFGNVVAEAMACETPVVGTDTGAVEAMIGTTGWLVPIKNPIAMADALGDALHEMKNFPNMWRERRIRCRGQIKTHFSIESLIQGLHHLWNNVVYIDTVK